MSVEEPRPQKPHTRKSRPRKPRPPGPSARERRGISCTDLEWEEARELARQKGTSITRLLVEAALNPPAHIFAGDGDGFEEDDSVPDDSAGQPLALTPDEQREIYDRIATFASAADNALLPTGRDNMNLQDGVRFLLTVAMDDLVTSGRPDRIHDLSAAMFDDPDRREQIRRWLAWRSGKG